MAKTFVKGRLLIDFDNSKSIILQQAESTCSSTEYPNDNFPAKAVSITIAGTDTIDAVLQKIIDAS